MWSQNKRCCLLIFLIYAIEFGLATNIYAQNLSSEQIREDFEFLNNALAEGHPGLYWYNSKQELDATTLKVETALSKVNDIAELHSLFVDIINTISCGHTAVLLPKEHYKLVDSVNLFLPFNISLVEGKVLIAESFTTNLSRGDQILSINNEPIDDIIEQLQRFIPVDKDINTKRARSIELIFSYYYAVYKGSAEKFVIGYKAKEKGKKLIKEIEAIGKHGKMIKSVKDFAPAQIPIEFYIDDAGRIVTLKLATFSKQSFKKHEINFKDTINSVFEYLAKNNISDLVIDLRWNNGGTMGLSEYLFSFFIDSTYLYYADAEIKQAVMEGTTKYVRSGNMLPMLEKEFGVLEPWDGIYYLSGEKMKVNPKTPRFKGKLYLLTNGLSFSATSAFISHVQQKNVGLIIGETPGGAFAGVNAGPLVMVDLPNSKIRLFYRTIYTKYNVVVNKDSTKVDIEVDNTLESFMNGKDIQLEYVLEELVKDQ